MKKISPPFLLFISTCFFSFVISASAQELSSSEKNTWKTALKTMERSDQLYRGKMIKQPELNTDSIWKLQSAIDSSNKQQFVDLTKQLGYPSLKRVGNETSMGLILHFTLENDFAELKDLFKVELDKGNMPPKHYAWWFDRCQRNMNKPIYFGQYTNEKFCGEQLKTFNQRRKEIGLEALEANPDCK
ncbi:hypothetical protein [Fluviicola taffensis]|uniref:hypothetical protein n=1 Tax=Fluviicola taffensis TaxID=191579 RepID=UPI003137CABC